VLIDLPKDLCASPASGAAGPTDLELPGYRIPGPPGPRQREKLIEAMTGAEKPLILSGAGVLHAGAAEPLIRFAERQQIPVVTTLLGLGSFPATHPLFFGMGGMHGTYAANMAISECDLLVNIGSRFDDRLTGALDRFAPNAVVAHVDIDPVELGKNVRPNIPILGDAALVLDQLNKRAETKKTPDTSGWIDHLRDYAGAHPLPNPRHRRTLTPQAVIKQVARIVGDEAIVTTDVGQHQMWAAQYYPFTRPNQWVTSGGLGTMGFGFPAAIGAQVAEPEKTVVAIVGDGGFQMTSEELAVVAEEQLPVKVVIVNNQVLGMVHQWQDAFYEKRYAQSNVSVQPDFVRLAESYGIRGARVTSEEEAEQTLPRLLADRRPAVIDCRISPDEIVLPMVPPGAGLSEMTGV
jgi:acetolactate synthase-1/2/3 large subunit